ncbi:MAG: nitroreductase family protein [Thermoanaerobacteraceae bacterium]|nr:nitroreductase family protein [Thermoanaerobacteraceae bacterium]
MDLFDAIEGRRSIRKYKEESLDENTIMKIIEAAIWAPSASNLQPWHFTAILNRDIIKRIRSFSPGMFRENPPCIIVLSLNKNIIKAQGEGMGNDNVFDLAMAAQNMMLSAYSLGLGSCIKLSFNREAVKKLIDLKEGFEPEFLITIGYPDEIPEPPGRRDIKEVLNVVR